MNIAGKRTECGGRTEGRMRTLNVTEWILTETLIKHTARHPLKIHAQKIFGVKARFLSQSLQQLGFVQNNIIEDIFYFLLFILYNLYPEQSNIGTILKTCRARISSEDCFSDCNV